VDSILVPPPKTLQVLELLPTEFSTLLLGLGKTGLIEELAEATTTGGTFFAPPNGAFKKLGPRINGFLFSKFGKKYLKALLKYQYAIATLNKCVLISMLTVSQRCCQPDTLLERILRPGQS
jgi:hypothetical protein